MPYIWGLFCSQSLQEVVSNELCLWDYVAAVIPQCRPRAVTKECSLISVLSAVPLQSPQGQPTTKLLDV